MKVTGKFIEQDELVKAIVGLLTEGNVGATVALAGIPAAGKSTLCSRVGEVLDDGRSATLPTEAVILSAEYRHAHGFSGTNLDSYDVHQFCEYVRIVHDNSVVAFNSYDWRTRCKTGFLNVVQLRRNGLLLLDGSVCAEKSIADLCDAVLFFYPSDDLDWLRFAVHRDMVARQRSKSESQRENTKKLKDMKMFINLKSTRVSYYIETRVVGSEVSEVVLEYRIEKETNWGEA